MLHCNVYYLSLLIFQCVDFLFLDCHCIIGFKLLGSNANCDPFHYLAFLTYVGSSMVGEGKKGHILCL